MATELDQLLSTTEGCKSVIEGIYQQNIELKKQVDFSRKWLKVGTLLSCILLISQMVIFVLLYRL